MEFIAILGLTVIIALYAKTGTTMGQSSIKWGLIGLAVFVSIQLTGLIPVLISDSPVEGMLIWQAMYLISASGSLGLIFLIAYHKKILKRRV